MKKEFTHYGLTRDELASARGVHPSTLDNRLTPACGNGSFHARVSRLDSAVDCPICRAKVAHLGDCLGEDDEADDAEKMRFVAGWNMPGYMPDNAPEEFATFDEAKRYIIDAIKRAEDDTEDEAEAEELAAFAEDVNLQSSPFGATCGNYHYFVSAIEE
jgi:hypothetical protein